MDKIKKQFKDFWQYFRLVRYGANSAEATKQVRKYLPSLLIVVFGFVVVFLQMDCGLNFFVGAVIGSAMGVGIGTAMRPSALSVAPFSPKQRIVFTFFSALLMAAGVAFVFFVISMVFVLIMAFIAFCISGENVFVYESYASQVGVYGSLFSILTVLLVFFTCYAIFFLERKRTVTVATVVFIVVLEILALVVINLTANATPVTEVYPLVNNGFRFATYANVPEGISALSAPWAVILVQCILIAAAIAASVLLSIRRFKSDKV